MRPDTPNGDDMDRTFEERAAELESRMADVRAGVGAMRDAMVRACADAYLTASEARDVAWDGYSYDPLIEDDCPKACDDVDAIYHEAEDTARALETLRRIVDALI